MGFNELSKLWFLTLLIPVIIFYFLKLKRPKVKVPSLFLWQRVLDDKRVNSPFQRFKRHILLLLQLLLLLFLVLAATDPYFTGEMSKAKRIPLIIDISASMGALDCEGGTSRFERAKERMKKLINNKATGQEFAIIAFSDRARKICGFTDNSRVLNDALDNLKIQDLTANIEDALRMIQAMSKNFRFKEAILYSDGNFPEKTNLSLSFKLSFQKISEDVPNIGITALSAQRSGTENWIIFAELTSAGNPKAALLELYHNGKLLGEETYVPNNKSSERISFSVPGNLASSLKLILKPDGFDALSSDNTAYITLPQLRPLDVYVSPNLKSVRAAMRGIDGITLFPKDKNSISPPPQSYDLLITDAQSHLDVDSKFVFTTGFIPKDTTQILQRTVKEISVVDWDREDPLLRHAQLSDLSIMEGTAFYSGKSEKDLESIGYKTVIFGVKGPLMIKKEWAGQTAYNLLFSISKSTLPFRIAFPIIIKNLVELAREKAGLADVTAQRTGILPMIDLLPNTKYSIETPNQTTITEKTAENGYLPAISAPTAGIYKLYEDKKKVAEIAVSLIDKQESTLSGTDKIKFNELSITAADNSPQAPHALWKYLALLALLILCVEWWFFNKRI